MKIEKLKSENVVAEIILEFAQELEKKMYKHKYYQFYGCQAWYSELLEEKYVLFKSYNTIVAIVNTETKCFIELGKWSRTTSKQVTRFCNEFYSDYRRILIV
jgi:hypothetical protein